MQAHATPHWKNQLPETLKLAVPVAVGHLGYMLMPIVDTILVGRLGPEALGGVGLGSALQFIFTAFTIGTLMGLDFFVSFAYGRGDKRECNRWLVEGVWLAVLLAVPSVALIQICAYFLPHFGFEPAVAKLAGEFSVWVSWSMIPMLIYVAFRQYLQAQNSVQVATVLMLLANFLNALFNWCFVYGHLGFPAFGVKGSGLATTCTRTLLCLALVAFALFRDRKSEFPLYRTRFFPTRFGLRELLKVGGPAGSQMLLEVTVFSLSTLLAGRLGALSLAAHTIVLNIASFVFMVPLGIAAAASVQVGQALGAGNHGHARVAGWTSLGLTVSFMIFSGLSLYFLGPKLLPLFSVDPEVIRMGSFILLLAAFFQIADGTQTVGTGALRGLRDTKTAALANLIGHWFVGLPVGYLICFEWKKGLPGIWIGLTLGLFIVSAIVVGRWSVLSRRPV